MWILLAILSALCLGFYDVSKKQALTRCSVVGVLTLSVVFSSLLLLPFFLASAAGWLSADSLFYVPAIPLRTHVFIVIKAALVLSSWICAYAAMKHLPITLVAPLNATRPMWTLLGALLLFGERLNGWQWAGVLVALGSFYAFSVIGKKEGVSLKKGESRLWVIMLFAGILLGAASGLYDKYLMRQFDHMAVQVFYTCYQAAMMLVVSLIMSMKSGKNELPNLSEKGNGAGLFILLISLFLILSDFVYFVALSYPDSLISVVSTVRRSGCIIPFLYGIFFLKDSHPRMKSICLLGVIFGMILLLIGTL